MAAPKAALEAALAAIEAALAEAPGAVAEAPAEEKESRRANGEGTIRRRKHDGRWMLRIMYGYRSNGKPNYKDFYGRTKKEALRKWKAYEATLHDGINPDARYTFKEWSTLWFEAHKAKIQPATQENYRYVLKHLNEHFGPRLIITIKPMEIEAFLQSQRMDGYSDSHLHNCRGLLYQIFQKAEANDYIRKNPVAYAEKMRSSGSKKSKDAFAADEVELLMMNLPTDKFGLGIRLMLGTGMRTQELLALEPKHIAEDGSTVFVRQAVKLVKGTVHVGTPKTESSSRDIPVPPSLRDTAMTLRNTDSKYIFESQRVVGLPCNPSHFRDYFKREVSKIPEVRLLTPHCCRHTYVSQMQALGVDLPTIQRLVGHTKVDMTDHYLHIQDSVRDAAMKKFSDAFPVVCVDAEHFAVDTITSQ